MRQQEMTFRTWGGARAGAGRKPKNKVAGVSHEARPDFDPRHPLHVTLRVVRMPSLRSQVCMDVLRRVFEKVRARFGCRLIHYNVQGNHLHLIFESQGKQALSRGLQGLKVRIARRLNTALGRTGGMFEDRYHAVALTSPRQVRNAIPYVLLQNRRHGAQAGHALSTDLDPCSSAFLFDGWKDTAPRAGPWDDTAVRPQTWLLSVGWRQHGLVNRDEIPGRAK